MLAYIQRQCLRYFLCQYSPTSPKRKTRDIVRDILTADFSAERVDEFLDAGLLAVQRALVEEFNARFSDGRPVRYQIADTEGVGTVIQGYRPQASKQAIAFQNALGSLSPFEFELLTAIVLKAIGCHEAFFTPSSHDQGVDAFGHQEIMSPTPYGTIHQLTWIAQAKHYQSANVSSGDIRELVGTKELLLAKAFSTVDARYAELRLRNFAPTALALVTVEEVPSTVRRLAENAGVYIIAASDLLHILRPQLVKPTATGIRKLIARETKLIPTLT